MGLLSKLFPKWVPLVCKPQDIVELIQQCVDVDAPLCRLVVEYHGVRYQVGVTSDFEAGKGCFDIVYYLDEQEFDTLEDFCRYALMGDTHFMNLETITVLEDEDAGDPRSYVLLEQREIKL